MGSGQIQDTKYQNIQGLGHAGQWGGDTTDIERDVVLKGNINKNRGHIGRVVGVRRTCVFLYVQSFKY